MSSRFPGQKGKYLDALPLFEKLNAQKSRDPSILEGYSYCTLEYSVTLTDPEAHKKIKNLDPALADLLKLSDQGLLEPFVLISKADAGIAVDYPAFRNAHRDKVIQYINDWILRKPLSTK